MQLTVSPYNVCKSQSLCMRGLIKLGLLCVAELSVVRAARRTMMTLSLSSSKKSVRHCPNSAMGACSVMVNLRAKTAVARVCADSEAICCFREGRVDCTRGDNVSKKGCPPRVCALRADTAAACKLADSRVICCLKEGRVSCTRKTDDHWRTPFTARLKHTRQSLL